MQCNYAASITYTDTQIQNAPAARTYIQYTCIICSPRANRKSLAKTNALSISCSKSLSDKLFRCSLSCERDNFLLLYASVAERSGIAAAMVGVANLLVLAWVPSPRLQREGEVAASIGCVVWMISVLAVDVFVVVVQGCWICGCRRWCCWSNGFSINDGCDGSLAGSFFSDSCEAVIC